MQEGGTRNGQPDRTHGPQAEEPSDVALSWGFGAWYVMLLTYWILMIASYAAHHRNSPPGLMQTINPYFLYGGLGIAAVFFIFLVRWWFYRRSLQKDPALRAAVDDERVQQSWLKAFRFAFFCLIGLFILTVFKTFPIPHGRCRKHRQCGP